MKKWWNWIAAIALCSLLFIAVPLTLPRHKTDEELKPLFASYLSDFNKSYPNPDEYATRFQHFLVSVREIDQLNAGSRGPDHCKAKYGLTKLSDMSKTEFKELHLSDEKMYKPPHKYGRSWSKYGSKYDMDSNNKTKRETDNSGDTKHNNHQRDKTRKKRAALPLKVDWRTNGVIGPIRNQGLCGACWAFSTVGTIEAMASMKSGKLESLSVQEVIDCAGLGNSGCAGGDICLLLDWLTLTDTVLQKDKEYPLKLTDGACLAKKNVSGVKVASFTCDEFVGAEDQIIQALALHGPVAVAVNAISWQNYLDGVIQYHCSGAPEDLNHAVELVGYDLTADVPYYIAKNSWGKDFGIGGYVHLAIGTNICGLANEVATVDVL